MSNYSMKESEEDYESVNRIVEDEYRIVEDEYRIIDDIEVKIKPKSFESIKGKNASVDYVHKILGKLIADLNDTFVSEVDYAFRIESNHANKLHEKLDNLGKVVKITNQDHEILTKNFNNLREEVEKLKIGTAGSNNIDEWETPTYPTMGVF